jgi:ferrous iron transport protein B
MTVVPSDANVVPSAAAPKMSATAPPPAKAPARVALLGNPNTGKTTLFNRLTGLRQKTSNFPGTTLEARVGRVPSSPPVDLVDLPGIYSLELDQLEAEVCRAVLQGRAGPAGQPIAEPDAVCIVADATNLARNLMLVGEAVRRRLPTVIAINMIDIARRQGVSIDASALERALGCPVVLVSARTGEGLGELDGALARARIPNQTPPGTDAGLRKWADDLYAAIASGSLDLDADSFTDRLDRVFTHPVLGVLCFLAIMGGLFWSIFSLARLPMDGIDGLFSLIGGAVQAALPAGEIRQFLTGGVLPGVCATLVFVPQIALLFFLISLLEDTGYLARAAFVVDRLLRPFGLPGHAFVPLLSSHACAIPGIMATRGIPDRRERLATILVAPFMSCSARLPVYVLVSVVLFNERPLLASLAFMGCYALGMLAGIVSALVARRTILRGRSRPMALELPSYKMPSLRTALLTTFARVRVFLMNAGTNILAILVILWWLQAYPHVEPPARATELRAQAAAATSPEEAQAATEEADHLQRSDAKSRSFAGWMGRTLQPVFAPLGYDRQLTVGVLTSFAAREVFVSTMAVVVTGDENKDNPKVLKKLAAAERDDGTPVFTTAVCWSLLVYYVLAMQCLPTLAVTAREAGGVRWAVLQLLWMSGMAYTAAAIVYQLLR